MTVKFSRLWSRRPSSSRGRPRPVARPRLQVLEDRLAPATFLWTGLGADANWTTSRNWSEALTGRAIAPNSADDVLVFPTGAQQLSNVNDYGRGTAFQQVRIEGDGYTLGGN